MSRGSISLAGLFSPLCAYTHIIDNIYDELVEHDNGFQRIDPWNDWVDQLAALERVVS